jgi:hypothetical protein
MRFTLRIGSLAFTRASTASVTFGEGEQPVVGVHAGVITLPEVKDGLRGWRRGRVITVVDRGLSSDENLRYLTRVGGHWIAGERMREGSPDVAEAPCRQGRYPDRARQPPR